MIITVTIATMGSVTTVTLGFDFDSITKTKI